jgi:hypothetical protein
MISNKLLMVLVIAGLLVAGCTSTSTPPQGNQTGPGQVTPPQNQSGNASGNPGGVPANATNPSCDSYCRGLPHIQCVGSWNISGTYPGCVCGFDCEATGQNASGQNPDEPIATPTNLTPKEMVQNGMARQKSDFYLSNTGVYTEKSYTWLREGSDGGGFLGGTAPPTDVLFDGTTITSIKASGFTVFDNEAGGSDKAYGLAIFNETHTALDGYTGSDTFDITYFPSMIDKDLKDCYVYTKDFNVDAHGGWLLTYYFKCARAVAK